MLLKANGLSQAVSIKNFSFYGRVDRVLSQEEAIQALERRAHDGEHEATVYALSSDAQQRRVYLYPLAQVKQRLRKQGRDRHDATLIVAVEGDLVVAGSIQRGLHFLEFPLLQRWDWSKQEGETLVDYGQPIKLGMTQIRFDRLGPPDDLQTVVVILNRDTPFDIRNGEATESGLPSRLRLNFSPGSPDAIGHVSFEAPSPNANFDGLFIVNETAPGSDPGAYFDQSALPRGAIQQPIQYGQSFQLGSSENQITVHLKQSSGKPALAVEIPPGKLESGLQIGRQVGDIVVLDSRMSRSHATVRFDSDQIRVTNNRSKNGVWIRDIVPNIPPNPHQKKSHSNNLFAEVEAYEPFASLESIWFIGGGMVGLSWLGVNVIAPSFWGGPLFWLNLTFYLIHFVVDFVRWWIHGTRVERSVFGMAVGTLLMHGLSFYFSQAISAAPGEEVFVGLASLFLKISGISWLSPLSVAMGGMYIVIHALSHFFWNQGADFFNLKSWMLFFWSSSPTADQLEELKPRLVEIIERHSMSGPTLTTVEASLRDVKRWGNVRTRQDNAWAVAIFEDLSRKSVNSIANLTPVQMEKLIDEVRLELGNTHSPQDFGLPRTGGRIETEFSRGFTVTHNGRLWKIHVEEEGGRKPFVHVREYKSADYTPVRPEAGFQAGGGAFVSSGMDHGAREMAILELTNTPHNVSASDLGFGFGMVIDPIKKKPGVYKLRIADMRHQNNWDDVSQAQEFRVSFWREKPEDELYKMNDPRPVSDASKISVRQNINFLERGEGSTRVFRVSYRSPEEIQIDVDAFGHKLHYRLRVGQSLDFSQNIGVLSLDNQGRITLVDSHEAIRGEIPPLEFDAVVRDRNQEKLTAAIENAGFVPEEGVTFTVLVDNKGEIDESIPITTNGDKKIFTKEAAKHQGMTFAQVHLSHRGTLRLVASRLPAEFSARGSRLALPASYNSSLGLVLYRINRSVLEKQGIQTALLRSVEDLTQRLENDAKQQQTPIGMATSQAADTPLVLNVRQAPFDTFQSLPLWRVADLILGGEVAANVRGAFPTYERLPGLVPQNKILPTQDVSVSAEAVAKAPKSPFPDRYRLSIRGLSQDELADLSEAGGRAVEMVHMKDPEQTDFLQGRFSPRNESLSGDVLGLEVNGIKQAVDLGRVQTYGQVRVLAAEEAVEWFQTTLPYQELVPVRDLRTGVLKTKKYEDVLAGFYNVDANDNIYIVIDGGVVNKEQGVIVQGKQILKLPSQYRRGFRHLKKGEEVELKEGDFFQLSPTSQNLPGETFSIERRGDPKKNQRTLLVHHLEHHSMDAVGIGRGSADLRDPDVYIQLNFDPIQRGEVVVLSAINQESLRLENKTPLNRRSGDEFYPLGVFPYRIEDRGTHDPFDLKVRPLEAVRVRKILPIRLGSKDGNARIIQLENDQKERSSKLRLLVELSETDLTREIRFGRLGATGGENISYYVLNDRVSANHARLTPTKNGGFKLADIRSSDGTLVKNADSWVRIKDEPDERYASAFNQRAFTVASLLTVAMVSTLYWFFVDAAASVDAALAVVAWAPVTRSALLTRAFSRVSPSGPVEVARGNQVEARAGYYGLSALDRRLVDAEGRLHTYLPFRLWAPLEEFLVKYAALYLSPLLNTTVMLRLLPPLVAEEHVRDYARAQAIASLGDEIEAIELQPLWVESIDHIRTLQTDPRFQTIAAEERRRVGIQQPLSATQEFEAMTRMAQQAGLITPARVQNGDFPLFVFNQERAIQEIEAAVQRFPGLRADAPVVLMVKAADQAYYDEIVQQSGLPNRFVVLKQPANFMDEGQLYLNALPHALKTRLNQMMLVVPGLVHINRTGLPASVTVQGLRTMTLQQLLAGTILRINQWDALQAVLLVRTQA